MTTDFREAYVHDPKVGIVQVKSFHDGEAGGEYKLFDPAGGACYFRPKEQVDDFQVVPEDIGLLIAEAASVLADYVDSAMYGEESFWRDMTVSYARYSRRQEDRERGSSRQDSDEGEHIEYL